MDWPFEEKMSHRVPIIPMVTRDMMDILGLARRCCCFLNIMMRGFRVFFKRKRGNQVSLVPSGSVFGWILAPTDAFEIFYFDLIWEGYSLSEEELVHQVDVGDRADGSRVGVAVFYGEGVGSVCDFAPAVELEVVEGFQIVVPVDFLALFEFNFAPSDAALFEGCFVADFLGGVEALGDLIALLQVFVFNSCELCSGSFGNACKDFDDPRVFGSWIESGSHGFLFC